MKGKTNRTKGHNAERLYAERFRELGYENCITARQGSRLHDDCGIDLINLPFNVQIKAGAQRGLNYSKTIAYTKEKSVKLSEEEQKKPAILIHKKPFKKGQNADNEFNELVIMTWKDFAEFFSGKTE